MGLGKTVQTIAFLAWLKRHEQTDEEAYRPHLIVAPASVISNWKREFETFAPDLHVVKYHGTLEERQSMQQELQRCKGNVDVVLASVSYMQKENSEDRSFLRKFRYNYLVVDEGHLLKNPRSNFYKNIDRFSTLHRLLLTVSIVRSNLGSAKHKRFHNKSHYFVHVAKKGTPVQNSPKELMSLLCFLMPLFSQKSKDEFDTSNGHDGGESMLQHFVSMQGTGTDDVAAYKKLKQLFSPFVLRRRKQDVLSQIMPPKERRVEFVDLDSTARAIYNSIIADHVKSRKSGTGVDTHLFTQLRKAAHHPLMLRNRFTSPEEKERLAHWFYRYGAFRGDGCTKAKVEEELEKFTDFDIHLMALELIDENEHRRNDLEKYVLDEEDLFRSAKFVSLRTLLPDLIADGHRILIFSVWTTCLDLLGCLLESLDIAHLRMDGSTAVGDRQSLIDKFNRDSSIPVFLLSTKACGLGINLTSGTIDMECILRAFFCCSGTVSYTLSLLAADTCIMHDLDFNPFNDLQAEDRYVKWHSISTDLGKIYLTFCLSLCYYASTLDAIELARKK
jgi:SWI/SNF-related matrix-associated actin-dependent regulator 1 of chromatin subfamily A